MAVLPVWEMKVVSRVRIMLPFFFLFLFYYEGIS